MKLCRVSIDFFVYKIVILTIQIKVLTNTFQQCCYKIMLYQVGLICLFFFFFACKILDVTIQIQIVNEYFVRWLC